MLELKPISKNGIPGAIAKAERYRLLNEPQEAESICRDILRIDPENEEVLVMLLLAITDQFGKSRELGAAQAQQILGKLRASSKRRWIGTERRWRSLRTTTTTPSSAGTRAFASWGRTRTCARR